MRAASRFPVAEWGWVDREQGVFFRKIESEAETLYRSVLLGEKIVVGQVHILYERRRSLWTLDEKNEYQWLTTRNELLTIFL